MRKMKKKVAIFCSHGLGDGLLFSILAYNLQKEGYEVVVFHNQLIQMSSWFFPFSCEKFPRDEEINDLLKQFDLIIINKDHLPINQKICHLALKNYSSKAMVLCPSTCKGKHKIGDFHFDIEKSIVDNLLQFLKQLGCTFFEKKNGIVVPKKYKYRKFFRRIVIHAVSNSNKRNWPISKFIRLALILKKEGYDPCFIMSKKERCQYQWIEEKKIFKLISFSSLDTLSSYIYESGYLIGNDSGVGHLSSCLSIPTLTIFSSLRKQKFWRPDWGFINVGITPWKWILNIKGLRLRKKYWSYTISVRKVLSGFIDLKEKCDETMRCN